MGTIIIVDDASQHFASANLSGVGHTLLGDWHLLIQTLMGTCPFVIADVAFQDAQKMRLVHEQEVVKTFFADRSHPAFGIGICIGRSHWSWDDMNAFRLEHVVKRIGVFAVMIAN